jgi:hypothetical protein
MTGFAFLAGSGIIVTYLALEPNRWLAIVFASLGLLLQWRAIVQAATEDAVERTEGEDD